MFWKKKYEDLVNLIDMINHGACTMETHDVLDKILEATNKEPEHNDEEQILIDITTAVRCFYSEKQALILNPKCQERFRKRLPVLLDYLRSIPRESTPAWKPTREQLNVLLMAAEYYGEVWGNPVESKLKEIYEQLKPFVK